MGSKREKSRNGGRELAGLILQVVWVLLLLALASYDVHDTKDWSAGGADASGTLNYIGPVGAWTAWGLIRLCGVAGFLLPVMLATLGVFLICRSDEKGWPRAAWMGGILAGCCVLADLQGAFWSRHTSEALNIGGMAGGFIGYLLGHQFLTGLLGRVGAALISTGLVLTGLFFVSGIHPAELWKGLAEGWQAWREAREERAAERRTAEEQAAHEALKLERERVKLERELAKQRREEEKAERDAQREREREEKAAEKERRAQEAAEAEERERAEAEEREKAEEAEREAFQRRLEEQRKADEARRLKEAEELRKAKEAQALEAKNAETEALSRPTQIWELPPMSLLDPLPEGAGGRAGPEELETTIRTIQQTLRDFGIEAEVTHVEQGPVVTRYELLPAAGVKVERIGNLSGNITLALKAESVRVEAPIPGKGVVGIEVPNRKSAPVVLRQVLESAMWTTSKAKLPLALGEDVGGNVVMADLTSLPHLLVAGATSMGKSVCLNSLLVGLLMSRTPEELGVILVDPKIVEFSDYAGLPHLMVPVITEPKKVVAGLRWAILEMQRRFKLFHRANVRDIASYNRRPKEEQTTLFDAAAAEAEGAVGEEDVEDAADVEELEETGGDMEETEATPKASSMLKKAETPEEEPMPDRLKYIIIVIDELADLMLEAQQDIEPQITKLTQLARATGIHLIIATQRPTVNIITGTIKSNVPGRIAFKVSQKNDSRVIIDREGADKLVGKGDMLALVGTNKVIRAQGAWTKDNEIRAVVDYWRKQGAPCFDATLQSKMDSAGKSGGKGSANGVGIGSSRRGGGGDDDFDEDNDEDAELLEQVIEVIRQTQRASTSSIQRRLRIGYNRASRLMDILEEKGLVGPARGAEPREILFDVGAATKSGDEDERA